MTSEQSLLTLKKIKRLSRTLKAFTEGCPECLRVYIYIDGIPVGATFN